MIKNLIFDVGDVLVEYRWMDMFKEYGLSEKEAIEIGIGMFQTEIWSDKLDRGLITEKEALETFREMWPEKADVIEWFLKHSEQMAVHRTELWPKIARLKEKGYKLYILSNYYKELFERHTKNAAVMELFDGRIVSYQVHLLKPEREIYDTLLKKYDLKADECLFFDDRKNNVEGARNAGIHAVQILSRDTINHVLDDIENGHVEEIERKYSNNVEQK